MSGHADQRARQTEGLNVSGDQQRAWEWRSGSDERAAAAQRGLRPYCWCPLCEQSLFGPRPPQHVPAFQSDVHNVRAQVIAHVDGQHARLSVRERSALLTRLRRDAGTILGTAPAGDHAAATLW